MSQTSYKLELLSNSWLVTEMDMGVCVREITELKHLISFVFHLQVNSFLSNYSRA